MEETPTDNDKDLVAFIVDHTDRWRDYRDQNFVDDWDHYERIFRGKWDARDKQRDSERSRVISPATQQAVETRHAEVMEAIFGQGEFFDIEDDIADKNGIDVEMLKKQLNEDFAQDKIRKSIDQIELLAEIYGTGIGEITVNKEKVYIPHTMAIDATQSAYGVKEEERVSIKITPVNPKNFIFDPNGTTIDDCMGVAVERHISIHKIVAGMQSGKYKKTEISSMYEDDSLESTQEETNFQDNKVKILTYYGLVPSEYLTAKDEEVIELFENAETEDYSDMVEAIIVIANGDVLLKAEENPYMMKDRPVVCYQDDTVPNRLLGRGTVEKAFNMQMAIDGQMRAHLDSLALTVAPMMGMDATRLPRGAKFIVKPGGNFLTNGNPSEILFPFQFGSNDGAAMNTSKEFERMLLMATGTIDSNGGVTQVSRDAGGLDMATATIIKKYKRTLVNFQEDFLIPFIYKAAWRYMQFSPGRYPSIDVKFIPTATLGIMAREYEQKQLAFMVQTLGANSPITPILMGGILKNSSLSNREELIQQMNEITKPDPQQQQIQQAQTISQLKLVDSQAAELSAKAQEHQALAQKYAVEANAIPAESQAKIMNAISTNLPNDDNSASAEFDRRVKITELRLKEEELKAKKAIVATQMQEKIANSESSMDYLNNLQKSLLEENNA